MTTYKDYYQRAYEQRQDELTGFKRVLGATGLGKTHGISLFIQWLRKQDYTNGLVYTTHRHNLLGGMEDTLKRADISSVYLRSNQDIAVSLTKDNDELENHCDELEKRYAFFSSIDYDVAQVLKLAKLVQLNKKNYDFLKANYMMVEDAQKNLNTAVSNFFGVFVNALRILHNNDKMQHETLMKEDGFLWQLFPYIRFLHAIPRPVLLVTTKKLLNGFFDGVSIKHWADLSKNIIFVDEFEHQEEEILKHLCEQPEMNNMFEFVRQFMTKVKGLTENHKSVVKARKVLEKFIKELERLEYLEIYDFMMAPGLFDKNKLSILQSRRLTSTSNFLITPEGKSWRIVKNDTPKAMRSRPLLYLFDRTSKSILTFFYNLSRNSSKTPYVFNHWVESVFNVHNDNMAGKYSSIISIHAQIPPLQEYHWKKTFDNQMVLESSYFKGMGMYSLERTNYIPAPDDVKVTQYNLFVTPELLLLRLCLRNLVFGLSATGDLPRVVNSFDVFWFQQLTDLFIPEDETDKELIREMIAEKDGYRGKYEVAYEEIKEQLNIIPQVSDWVNNLSSKFWGKNDVTHRKSFLLRFFNTLDFIKSSQNQAHLAYINSYADLNNALEELSKGSAMMGFKVKKLEHIKGQYLITYDGAEPIKVEFLNAERMAEIKKMAEVSSFDLLISKPQVRKKKDKKTPVKKNQQAMFGSDGQEDEPTEEATVEYAAKLLVVTQFKTASLGVNLEWCKPDDPTKLDFEGLHILNPFMFYFEVEKSDFKHSHTSNFWKLNKLRESARISDQPFELILKQPDLHTAFYEFNFGAYKATDDYKYNIIALMEQVLGRLERQWEHAPKCYEVRACKEIHKIWVNYLTSQDDSMAMRRNDRERYLSSLIKKVYAGVLKGCDERQWYNDSHHQRILQKELDCKHDLDELIKIMREMREGLHSGHESKIISLWYYLRHEMVQQNYQAEDFKINLDKAQFELKFRERFMFQAYYIQADDSLWVDREYELVYCIYPQDNSLENYSLNKFYRNFANNPVIVQYFEARGYPMGHYKTPENYVFIPYAAQSILAGALGEAAVEALLDDQGVKLEKISYHQEHWQIFELSDMKILDKPIYIDVKNYSEGHLQALQANDAEAIKLLSDALLKRNTIAQRTQDERTKYAVINVQLHQDHPANYFDAKGNRVQTFQECAVVIIQGCFNPRLHDDENNKGKLLSQFALFIDNVKDFEESSHG